MSRFGTLMPSARERRNSGERRSIPKPDQPFEPETGAVPFPGYRLERLRGRGGYATVWEAIDPNGERLALKFMSSQNSSSTARELRSVQAIHKLSHPRLLRTRQVWSLPGQIVIGMDLADASLLDLFLLYIDEFGKLLEPEKVCLYLYQTAEALDFLNGRKHVVDGNLVGFQHGDVKPNNILLVGDEAKLADYGLSTPMSGHLTPCARQGTLEYAAPEIFAGTLTESSDQFALAVTYYLLRTGNFPFPAPPALIPRGYNRPAPDLSLLEKSEQTLLARALSPVPQDRYSNCVELMNNLMRVRNLEVVRDSEKGMSVRPTQDSVTRSKLLQAIKDAKLAAVKT